MNDGISIDECLMITASSIFMRYDSSVFPAANIHKAFLDEAVCQVLVVLCYGWIFSFKLS